MFRYHLTMRNLQGRAQLRSSRKQVLANTDTGIISGIRQYSRLQLGFATGALAFSGNNIVC